MALVQLSTTALQTRMNDQVWALAYDSVVDGKPRRMPRGFRRVLSKLVSGDRVILELGTTGNLVQFDRQDTVLVNRYER